jgi:hypothetical protein
MTTRNIHGFEFDLSNRLNVFGNKELRKIFGPNRCKVTGEWRNFHNEELHDL